ncbi:MAG: DUF3109 family protein [Bacteroidales bacterium]
MIQIGDKILSRELFTEHFLCDLPKCEGNCCVFGDAGAPLSDEEAGLLVTHLPKLTPFLRPEGRKALEEQGAWVFDTDGDRVTPLVEGEECAYATFEGGIAKCAIETAYEQGVLDWQKPLSCHLYPIRVTPLKKGVALNYHRWSICEPARLLGAREGLPVFRFLKSPLTRAFGSAFYQEMELIYSELMKQESGN